MYMYNYINYIHTWHNTFIQTWLPIGRPFSQNIQLNGTFPLLGEIVQSLLVKSFFRWKQTHQNPHVCYLNPNINNQRKFRSQTSDNTDRWKAEQGRGREKRKIRRKKSRRERVRRKKMQMHEKVCFFQWFSRLAKAAGAEPAGQIDVEKVHTVVARSTFRSQNVQNTPVSGHFWKLRCRKSARRCGAKHISKSKCTKHTRSGPLLAVEMSKKCTLLWREAHFQVKMYKTHQLRTTFGSWDVEKVHAVVARSTFPSQNVQNTTCSRHFWRFKSWKSARRCGAKHISKWTCTKH